MPNQLQSESNTADAHSLYSSGKLSDYAMKNGDGRKANYYLLVFIEKWSSEP